MRSHHCVVAPHPFTRAGISKVRPDSISIESRMCASQMLISRSGSVCCQTGAHLCASGKRGLSKACLESVRAFSLPWDEDHSSLCGLPCRLPSPHLVPGGGRAPVYHRAFAHAVLAAGITSPLLLPGYPLLTLHPPAWTTS